MGERPITTLHVEPKLENATLVAAFEGWNDAGEAASSAVQYIGNAIAAVPLAEIDGEPFLDLTVCRPTVRYTAGRSREIAWPATRFQYGSTDANRELVLATGHEPHVHWRRYCDEFVGLIERLKIPRVVLLGAYVADVVYSRPVGVTGFGSDENRLAELDVGPSDYEGPTGIVGVLADLLGHRGVEVLSFWAGLPHYIHASPNPRGSLALLQKVRAGLSLAIDDEPLRVEAAAFEEKISEIVAADPELTEYVRQLKRREFAQ